jgi:hypothetical protein
LQNERIPRRLKQRQVDYRDPILSMAETKFPKLENPPIIEAILDLQVIFSEPPDLNQLKSLHELFRLDYPILEEQIQTHFQFAVTLPGPLGPSSG